MSEAGERSTRMVALVCPTCGADLDGLPGDRVFGCRDCSVAFAVDGDGLRAERLECWEPEAAGDALHFPVWVFEIEASVVLPPEAHVHDLGAPGGAERIVPFPGDRAYVAAFDIRGRSRFGDPGLHMTRKQPQPAKRAAGPFPRLAGATLARADAEAVVPFCVLSIIDARIDVRGGRPDVRISAATLALVPFGADGDGVREPFGGPPYPPAAIPDLAAIRRVQRV